MKLGLVLEGGGMRGLYTVGALDYLAENNIQVDYVVGVSAGACNAASFVSGQKGRGLRVIINYIGDKRYVGISNYIKTKSMFGMNFIFDEIPHKLDTFDYNSLLASPCEFKIGVTNAKTGKSEYFSKEYMKNDCTLLRASSSIPIFSPIVKFEGGEYFDGGTSDPIPVRKAIEDGCDKVIIVLTRDRSYVKPPEKFKRIYKHILKKYPEMIKVLDNRHVVYKDTIEYINQLEKDGRAIVISPSVPLKISRFEKDRNKLYEIYKLGKSDAAGVLQVMNQEKKKVL